MHTFTKFSLRFGIYSLVVIYLACDLILFNGPLNRRIQAARVDSPESIARSKAEGVVARVFHHPITRTQLERAIHERLWLEGKNRKDLDPRQLQLVTYAALGELIDHQLLRLKVKYNTIELPVSDEEIDERVHRFVSRFETKSHLETAMKGQGIPNETALRHRIAARIQQEKYVAMRVDPISTVEDEEAREWFAENHENLTIPHRVRARHIFIRTLTRPPEEAREMLVQALAQLTENEKDFPTLVADLCDDPASKAKQGDLGWMTKSRLPADFAEPLFDLPTNQPALIRTKLGWHLVEVTETKPAEAQDFDQVRDEVIAALTARKRHHAVIDFRSALRQFERHRIEIFHDQLSFEP